MLVRNESHRISKALYTSLTEDSQYLADCNASFAFWLRVTICGGDGSKAAPDLSEWTLLRLPLRLPLEWWLLTLLLRLLLILPSLSVSTQLQQSWKQAQFSLETVSVGPKGAQNVSSSLGWSPLMSEREILNKAASLARKLCGKGKKNKTSMLKGGNN